MSHLGHDILEAELTGREYILESKESSILFMCAWDSISECSKDYEDHADIFEWLNFNGDIQLYENNTKVFELTNGGNGDDEYIIPERII